MRFKYFFSAPDGDAPENEINTWLAKHPDIKIHFVTGCYDCVYIFYDENSCVVNNSITNKDFSVIYKTQETK